MVGFIILAVVMVSGAVGVITLREPVHAALSLVATLLTLAVTYITLQAHFLAAVQVIVYAGAIMVLFLFVIMLLNVGSDESDPLRSKSQLPGLRVTAYVVAVLAAAGIAATAFLDPRQLPTRELIDVALAGGGAEQVGRSMFSDFVLAFQLVGVLLLTGIVGAVGLVQRRPPTVSKMPPETALPTERELSRG